MQDLQTCVVAVCITDNQSLSKVTLQIKDQNLLQKYIYRQLRVINRALVGLQVHGPPRMANSANQREVQNRNVLCVPDISEMRQQCCGLCEAVVCKRGKILSV